MAKTASKTAATGDDRKRNMVNIWVGKQVGPELDSLARRESEATGHSITRIDLGRELFLWALGRYRESGSLARMKSLKTFRISARYAEDVQLHARDDLEKIFGEGSSEAAEEVVHELRRLASGGRKRAKSE